MKVLTRLDKFYALAPPGGRIAEVGVWRGDNADLILKVAKPSLLLLVDQWSNEHDPTNVALMGTDTARIEATYQAVVQRFIGHRSVVVARMSSLAAAALAAARFFDLVYVDASHLHVNVLADLQAWARTVCPGGLLAGHDWDYYPDVNRAVADFLAANPHWSHEYLVDDRYKGKAKSYGLRAPQLV